MKRPFFFWSDTGSSFALALKLQREGHPVMLYIKTEHARNLGRGVVPKTTRTDPPKRSILIFDTTGQGSVGAAYRRQGFKVIGGNPFDKPLETDRMEGLRRMRDVGITHPETHAFKQADLAIKFLESQAGQWFVKVSGDMPESSTFDAPRAESMIRYLEWIQTHGHPESFILQRKVTGTEVSLNAWFDGERFIPPWEVTMEEKHFLTGNRGPRTGCESEVVWLTESRKLFGKTLGPMAVLLRREGYVGPLDLNMKLQGEGTPMGLEWTARLGFDATDAWMSHYGHLGEQLEAFAEGELRHWEPLGMTRRVWTLRVTIPPYPTWEPKLFKGNTGLPLDDQILNDPWIFPGDVMRVVGGVAAASESGITCVVGCEAGEVEAARRMLVGRADALEIPNKQYRIDPVSRYETDLPMIERSL